MWSVQPARLCLLVDWELWVGILVGCMGQPNLLSHGGGGELNGGLASMDDGLLAVGVEVGWARGDDGSGSTCSLLPVGGSGAVFGGGCEVHGSAKAPLPWVWCCVAGMVAVGDDGLMVLIGAGGKGDVGECCLVVGSAKAPLPLGVGWEVVLVVPWFCGGAFVAGVMGVSMAGQANALSRLLVLAHVEERKHLLSATLAPMSQKYWRDNCMPWIRAEACFMRHA